MSKKDKPHRPKVGQKCNGKDLPCPWNKSLINQVGRGHFGAYIDTEGRMVYRITRQKRDDYVHKPPTQGTSKAHSEDD